MGYCIRDTKTVSVIQTKTENTQLIPIVDLGKSLLHPCMFIHGIDMAYNAPGNKNGFRIEWFFGPFAKFLKFGDYFLFIQLHGWIDWVFKLFH